MRAPAQANRPGHHLVGRDDSAPTLPASDSSVRSRGVAGLLTAPPRGSLRRFLAVLLLDPLASVVAFGGTVVASLASLAMPQLAGTLTASVQSMDMVRLPLIGAVLIGLALLSSVVSAGVNLVSTRAGNAAVREFRDASAQLALRLPADRLVDHPTADLVARCTIDAERVGDIFTRGPARALGGIVLVGGSLVQMLRIDALLCVSAFALTLVCFAVIALASRRLVAVSFARQEAKGDYVAECTRVLESTLTLRAFVAQRFAIRRLAACSAEVEATANRCARSLAWMGPVVSAAVQATLLAVVLMAVLRVQQGFLPVDQLVSFFLYVLMMVGPITSSSETVMLMADVQGALRRLFDVATLVGEAAEAPGVPAPEASQRLAGEVRFRNVSVRYPSAGEDQPPALTDVSFDVPAGSWVALTGASGSGKSTILALLERFLTPSTGLILVDGRPLDEVPEDGYRTQVGYIEQGCPLFSGTVRDNLQLGRPGIDDQDCWEMLEKVGLAQLVADRSGGLDAPVGESQYAFSGGERQRLAIARTLLGRPRMLLLDEITTGLDVPTRRQVLEVIRRASDGITVFAADHGRLGATWADQVLVLERGRLVDLGDPSDVAGRSALYRSLTAS